MLYGNSKLKVSEVNIHMHEILRSVEVLDHFLWVNGIVWLIRAITSSKILHIKCLFMNLCKFIKCDFTNVCRSISITNRC